MTSTGKLRLKHPKYRPDIDGLRAVAVLAVVAYHAFPRLLHGGFVGVDVFFVVSGYLISTIIYQGLADGSFSFLVFYGRRIRRIFPALILVLAGCLVFGWIALISEEYKQLGEHIAGGAGFVSNYLLWAESGYFDKAANSKPLLHLWSLGIEEQFYIVWPLLLWISYRTKIGWLVPILAVAIVSYRWNLDKVEWHTVEAFYSPQTRFWELAIGALLAYAELHALELRRRGQHLLASKNRMSRLCARGIVRLQPAITRLGRVVPRAEHVRHALSLVGAALIAIAALFISPKDFFPGTLALLPTAGAAAILAAGPSAFVNRWLLSTRMLVGVGLISFPLYLWHWPLLCLAPTIERGDWATPVRLAMVPLSFGLAWLTYEFVEKPIRFGGRSALKATVLLSTMVCVGGLGYLVFSMDGVKSRHPEVSAFLDYFANDRPSYRYFTEIRFDETNRSDCNFYDVDMDRAGKSTQVPLVALPDHCTTKANPDSKVVFLWGDSHVLMLAEGLQRTLPPGWELLIVGASSCAPSILVAADARERLCGKANIVAMREIERLKPDVVVMAQMKGHDFDTVEGIAKRLRDVGVKKSVFIGPDPQWDPSLPTVIARRAMLSGLNTTPERMFKGLREDVVALNDRLQAHPPSGDFALVDLMKFFCNSDGCQTRIGPSLTRDITTFDYGHLTPATSIYLARSMLAKVVFGDDAK